jgi:hypothetical protein
MDLEVVAQRRDVDGAMADRALEIVRKFIVERGLILFGGLAIDYALRLRGARIYPDDERPDFDFLSPRSVDDAYDLADRLRAAGFGGVGAVRGVHVQTMRVRVDFVWVADIGYCPRDVFDRIPTLDRLGMRVVHPDFQRMDMHLAFCFPFNNPPQEDIFHRWRKDLKRLNLFEQHYPIAAASPAAAGPHRRVTAALAETPFLSDSPASLTVALHGFAAYSALVTALDELGAALGDAEIGRGLPRVALAFADDRTFTVELPAGDAAHVSSFDPGEATRGMAPRWYDPYMDVGPESARVGDLVVVSTRAKLLAVAPVRAGGRRALVVTPQWLLLFFLLEAHRAEAPPERQTYLSYYAHTMEVLRRAERAVAAAGCPAAAAADLFMSSPFAPGVRTFGRVNNSASYVIRMAGHAERVGQKDAPPASLGLDPDFASVLSGLPRNYYPDTASKRPEAFDYEKSPLFHRSGALRL